MRALVAAMMILGLTVAPAHAEWQPKGPIKLWIGFGAGGGTDSQARALAGELEALKGWRVIPENKAGGGGAVMAAQLKDVPPDGQILGMATNETFDFSMLKNDAMSMDDFTLITTTSGSQMAVLARADSGWKTLDDMVAAAKSGTTLVWANWGEQVQAASEVIARKFGIQVNHLRVKGGKGSMDAIVARDANVAWGGGVQRGLVAAGELVVLASAEQQPLVQAPTVKTLREYGIPYNLGFQFVIAGPKGLSNEVRDAVAAAIAEVLSKPDSKTRQFIEKQYPPGPVLIAGDALTAQLKANLVANQELLKATGQ